MTESDATSAVPGSLIEFFDSDIGFRALGVVVAESGMFCCVFWADRGRETNALTLAVYELVMR